MVHFVGFHQLSLPLQHRLPFDNSGRKRQGKWAFQRAANNLKQRFYRPIRFFGYVLMYGCQAGSNDFCQNIIVKTGNRNIFRHPQSLIIQIGHRFYRVVIRNKHPNGIIALFPLFHHAREQALQTLLSPSGSSPDKPLPSKTAASGTLLPNVYQMPSSASPFSKPEAGFAIETTAGIDLRFSLAVDFLLRPEQNAEPAASALVERARDYLRLHFAQPISLSTLADTMGVTSAYLSALFHREIGLSYSRYLLTLRMEDAARRLLADPDARISDVGEAVGFPSAKHFSHDVYAGVIFSFSVINLFSQPEEVKRDQ